MPPITNNILVNAFPNTMRVSVRYCKLLGVVNYRYQAAPFKSFRVTMQHMEGGRRVELLERRISASA